MIKLKKITDYNKFKERYEEWAREHYDLSHRQSFVVKDKVAFINNMLRIRSNYTGHCIPIPNLTETTDSWVRKLAQIDMLLFKPHFGKAFESGCSSITSYNDDYYRVDKNLKIIRDSHQNGIMGINHYAVKKMVRDGIIAPIEDMDIFEE